MSDSAVSQSPIARLRELSVPTSGAVLPAGVKPAGVAVTRDGSRVYVANFGDNTVSVLAAGTGEPIRTPIVYGERPVGVAISPNGTRCYVANNGSNTVSVLDTTVNAVVAQVPVGAGPVGVVVTSDGRRACVANGAANTVSLIDTGTSGTRFPSSPAMAVSRSW